MARGRMVRVGSAVAALVCLVAACSSGGGGSGGTPLVRALSRVAANSVTTGQIVFDDTAGLNALTGGSTSVEGIGALRGSGADMLHEYVDVLPDSTGIDIRKARFSISAGLPPNEETLVAGGQSPSAISAKLTASGYQAGAGVLTAPGLDGVDPQSPVATLVITMRTVRATGADLAFSQHGGPDAVGSPKGRTLASDPTVRPLADCLGDVVAAQFERGWNTSGTRPVEIAVGVRRPHAASDPAQTVVCVTLPDTGSAAAYRTRVRSDLATGISARGQQPWSKLVTGATVDEASGGDGKTVRWQGTAGSRWTLPFTMLVEEDLPGLPTPMRGTA